MKRLSLSHFPSNTSLPSTSTTSPIMEVDMQSPPSTFRPMPFTIKRPRSPGSPTQERHTKRLSLAPVSSEGHVRRVSAAADGVMDGRTANQDDWVRQARELSITSPLSVTSSFPSALDGGATVAQSRADEHMAVDDEASLALRVHVHPGSSSRPWSTTKGHLPLIHISTTTTTTGTCMAGLNEVHALSSPAPFSVLTAPSSSSTESTSSTSPIGATQTRASHPCPPDIFLLPATPLDTPSHQHQFGTDYGPQQTSLGDDDPQTGHARMSNQGLSLSQPSLLTRMQDRVDGSPRPSRVHDVPTSLGRKHRVMMGPRADCVKCRTGVRGHWMHFD